MPIKRLCQFCNSICYSKKQNATCIVCRNKNRSKTLEQTKHRQRYWHLYKKYKIDELGFDCLWIAFKGKCGICNVNLILPIHSRGQPLNAVVIDHNHKTNNIRGLLCNKCNKGLGLFNDDPLLLIKAKDYLL